jgi:hypothetical protein
MKADTTITIGRTEPENNEPRSERMENTQTRIKKQQKSPAKQTLADKIIFVSELGSAHVRRAAFLHVYMSTTRMGRSYFACLSGLHYHSLNVPIHYCKAYHTADITRHKPRH